MPSAVLLAASAAAISLLIAYRRGLLGPLAPDRLLPPALLTTLALLVTPYVHLNDLVLEALPVLLIASLPLTIASRTTLILWGLGSATPIFWVALTHAENAGLPARIGALGLLLSVLTAVALVASTSRPRTSSHPSEGTPP